MSLSELPFASFLAYSPRGESEVAKRSRAWMNRLKGDSLFGLPGQQLQPTTRWIAQRLRARLEESELSDCFRGAPLLIPVPSSTKQQPGTGWVPLSLATEMLGQGLGGRVSPCLVRAKVVRKSSTAPPDLRPRAREHFESMALERDLLDEPEDILLVDDIVTRGATLLGAAQRVQEAFPESRVRAFAAIRTISDPAEFEAIYAPATGTITLRGEESYRRP